MELATMSKLEVLENAGELSSMLRMRSMTEVHFWGVLDLKRPPIIIQSRRDPNHYPPA